MGVFADPLVDGWKPERVIWEVALKEGFGLNCRVERLEGTTVNTVWRVTDPDKEQSFRICLDATLDPGAIRSLDLGRDDLFICRDIALDDSLAANLALQCRLKAI
jgi:adenine-specific DNA-methyltransferase